MAIGPMPPRGIVEIWRIRVVDAAALLAVAAPTRAEAAAILRFRQASDRAERTVARALTRFVLGRRLGIPPEAVPVARTARGRPFLAGHPDVSLNLSHGQGAVLLAVAAGRAGEDVGIDLEAADRVVDLDGVLDYAFSPAEQAEIGALPAPARRGALLQGWTRKEAVLKAAGLGLAVDPRALSLTGAEPARGLATLDGRAIDWMDLDLGAARKGTLARIGGIAGVRGWCLGWDSPGGAGWTPVAVVGDGRIGPTAEAPLRR